jgi:hypothetical protein
MKLKTLFSILMITVIMVSCKKEKATEPAPEPEAPATIPNSPYTVSTATVFSGIFSLTKNTLLTYSNHYTYGVSFFDTLSANYNPGDLVSVASVRLNSKTIQLDSTFHDYRASDLVITSDYGTETWQIEGANGVPSFNYTSSTDPKCTNFYTLPDSLNISSGITFTLNVTNIDMSGNQYMGLTDNSGHFAPSKLLVGGINVITFTNAELVNFSTTYLWSLSISLINKEVLNFYGKDFQFIKRRSYDKFVKIKP